MTIALALSHPIAQAISDDTAAVLAGSGFAEIVAERLKQITKHGFTRAHDRQFHPHELAQAANAVLAAAIDMLECSHAPARARANNITAWPLPVERFHLHGPRESLIVALALGWAALDRLDDGADADPELPLGAPIMGATVQPDGTVGG